MCHSFVFSSNTYFITFAFWRVKMTTSRFKLFLTHHSDYLFYKNDAVIVYGGLAH